MSNVSGLVDISIALSETTATPTKTVFKTVSLIEESEGLTGKIAVVSGTVGASPISITPTYRNASGETVSFDDRGDGRGGMNRIVVKTDGTNAVQLTCGPNKVLSASGCIGATDTPNADTGFSVQALSGTADYLVSIYADGD